MSRTKRKIEWTRVPVDFKSQKTDKDSNYKRNTEIKHEEKVHSYNL